MTPAWSLLTSAENTWKFYTLVKVLPTIKKIQLIDKKEFAKGVLDREFQTFVMYVVVLESSKMIIHSF